jgi:transglutaminase-like putative cysteine protease
MGRRKGIVEELALARQHLGPSIEERARHDDNLRPRACRDLAMLMIEAVRSLGMAARFVSGYLHVLDHNDDHNLGSGNTHAWVQVYLPGPGWVDFDPASGIVGNRGLVRIAVARDPRQAIPLHGTWTGFPSDNLGMTVEVNVTANATGPTAPNAPA